LQSKWTALKNKFYAFKTLKIDSSFGWDPMLKIPVASDEVWERYFEFHPKARVSLSHFSIL
jgi:hypothetical protein